MAWYNNWEDFGNLITDALTGGAATAADANKWNKDVSMQNLDISKQNLGFQQEQLAYEKSIQQKIFDREDSSIQRRVADLRRAGLSPVLAAGQGADAGAVVKTSAPQQEQRQQTNFNVPKSSSLLEMINTIKDISMTNAQMDLINAQKESVNADVVNKLENAKKIQSETNYLNNQNAALVHDFQMFKGEGTSSKPSGLTRSIIEGKGFLKKLSDKMSNSGFNNSSILADKIRSKGVDFKNSILTPKILDAKKKLPEKWKDFRNTVIKYMIMGGAQ